MTPQEKVEELVENLGVYNGLYLAEEVLIVLEDYEPFENNINEWEEVRDLLQQKQEKLN
jgi:hypothetical protein